MSKINYKFLFTVFLIVPLFAQAEIESVLLHPVFNQYYSCAEHWDGQFKEMGDSLGTDCFIQKFVEVKGRSWLRSYKNEGHKNEDWFGWHQDVLAPIDGKVFKINENNVINKPGIMGKGMATWIAIKRDDGLMVILAHVDNIKVKVNDEVKTGQVIALVGNNGQSRHPHIHIGAWKEKIAFQIRFHQSKIKGL